MIRRRTINIWLAVVLPCALFLAFLAALIWGINRDSKATEYQNATKSMFARAYNEFVNELNNLEVSMSKLQIVGSKAQCIMLLDDVWKSCGYCTGLLSQIPASHTDSYEMNQFLIRVGDYAKSLSTAILHGEAMTSEDTEQLSSLRKTCLELAQKVTERYNSGEYPDDLLASDKYFENSENSFQSEETRQDYPTLIYDGPFSESAEKMTPKGVSGNEITRSEAYEMAMEYIGRPVGLEFSSDSNGDIASYDFTGTVNDGRYVDISISKKGGHLVWLMMQATSDLGGIPDDNTLKAYKRAASDYLNAHGFEDMESTYAQFYDGVALINYAAKDGDIILYSDLVKVWVDRTSGDVIGVDARNYLFSHVKRDIKKAEIDEDDAKLLISENLDVSKVSLALIPTTPETEVLCYEFKGSYAGQSYIVYINAWTGEEQQIFRIIDTDSGALVV